MNGEIFCSLARKKYTLMREKDLKTKILRFKEIDSH